MKEKANKKKTNIKRIAILIVIIILSVCLSLEIGKTIYVQYHKAEAAEYLADKYGFNKGELHLVDYRPSRFHDDSSLGVLFDWYWTPEKWKFRYRGRTFAVVKSEDMLCDDYQLEEIFEWSVKYLKSIDENVIGIELESGLSDKVLTEDDVEDFIKEQESFFIYYHVDDLSKYYYISSNGWKYSTEAYDEMCKKILSKYSFLTDNNEIKKNKGVVLVSKNIDFKRKKYQSFADYYYDMSDDEEKLKERGELVG